MCGGWGDGLLATRLPRTSSHMATLMCGLHSTAQKLVTGLAGI